MKKIWLIGLIFPFIIACNNSDDTDDPEASNDTSNGDVIIEYDLDEGRISAVEFNDELSLMMEGMLNQVDVLFQSDSANIQQNLDNALFEADVNISSLSNMNQNEFKGAINFIESVRLLMEFYRDEFKNVFPKIVVPAIRNPNADQSELDVYDADFALREKQLFDSIAVYQDQFARLNNIRLEEQ